MDRVLERGVSVKTLDMMTKVSALEILHEKMYSSVQPWVVWVIGT